MPRQLRVEYPGAIYHIMSRGDRAENIFLADVDRHDFLRTLAEAAEKAGFQVHAYCLMSNHYHLVLETPNANLVAGMTWLQSTYTIRLNRRHNLTGHVFSGRYKALLVDGSGNGYFRTACDYVHLNPVRAGLLKPEDRLVAYPWSSFGFYLAAREHRPEWLRVDRLLGEHGIQQDTSEGRLIFEAGMEARRSKEEDPEVLKVFRRGWYLGSPEFKAKLLEHMEGKLGDHHSGKMRRETASAKADRIIREELARAGWEAEQLRLRRKNDPQKLSIAARLHRETTLPLRDIAARVGLGSSKSASATLHRWMRRENGEMNGQSAVMNP